MRLAVVTSFHAAGYRSYGKRFLQSFDKHWPADIPLLVYCENVAPEERSDRIEYRDLLACSQDLVAFKTRHEDFALAHGKLHGGGYEYRMDAVRFAHKTFSIFHALDTLADYDHLLWLDADTFTFRDIPPSFFAAVLPGKEYITYLGREQAAYSECGFVIYNLRHPQHEAFMGLFRDIYRLDLVFDIREWHDSFIFDFVRKRFERAGLITNLNLSARLPAAQHPFINTILGDYMDHLKGHKRKEAGHSFAKDLEKDRHERYWRDLKKG